MAIKFLNTVQVDTDVLYVDAANNRVGVGTTAPAYQLDVVSAGDGLLSLTGATKPAMIFKVGTAVVGGIQAQANTSLSVSAYGTSSLNLQTVGTTPRLTILTGGNVGIGMTSPSAILEVQGTNSNTQAALKVTDSGDSFFEVVPDNSTTFKIGDLDAVGDEAKIVGTFSDITFSKGGTTTMILDSNNNVGIGTASPSTKLHVVGTLRAGGSSDYIELDTNGNIKMSDSIAAILPTAHSTQTLSIGATMTGYWDTIVHHFGNEAVWIPGFFGAMDGMNLSNAGDLLIKGDVGIGTTAPLEKLQVAGNAAIYGEIKGYTGSSSNQYLSILQSGSLTYISTGTTNETIYFGIGPVANTTNINCTGTATATNFILSSDKRLKKNIKDLKPKKLDVKWKSFELKLEPDYKRVGVIAQELEKTNPEFVREDVDGTKSVAYIDLLITKIVELEARLEKAGL